MLGVTTSPKVEIPRMEQRNKYFGVNLQSPWTIVIIVLPLQYLTYLTKEINNFDINIMFPSVNKRNFLMRPSKLIHMSANFIIKLETLIVLHICSFISFFDEMRPDILIIKHILRTLLCDFHR